MQLCRQIGLVWAVLALGFFAGCSSSNRTPGTDGEEDEDGGHRDGGRADSGGDDAGGTMDSDVECVPKGCLELEYECGEADDGCGGALECGASADACKVQFETCAGGGTANQCGCTPKTCESISSADGVKACGTIPDGCGGPDLNCGGDEVCTGEYDSCAGGGTQNQCGCSVDLSACAGLDCGTASDGCGGTVTCGQNAGQCSAARSCTAGKTCACRPDAELCGGKCGLQNIDGCSVDCGNSEVSCQNTCASQGACAACGCPSGTDEAPGTPDDEICLTGTCCRPDPTATTCGAAQCGTKVNNCGQPVTCGVGTCAAGNSCVQDLCIDSKRAALIGDYAVRNVSFAYITPLVTRNEGISRIRISLNPQGDLVMRESACSTRAYSALSGRAAAELLPDLATKVEDKVSVISVPSPVAGLPGAPEWFREKRGPEQDTLGWRRGRPTFCPLPSAGVPAPGPSADLPGYAPAPDPYSKGAKKPWLLPGADCRCPEQETVARGLCAAGSAIDKSACVANWAQNTLPFSPNKPSLDEDVTDCRVIDEDGDMKPGITLAANALASKATLRSATLSSVRLWGDIDESGARRHTGVSQDQPDTANANVACLMVTGAFGNTLCGTSKPKFCDPYISDGVSLKRSNVVDFVPLENQVPSTGGAWDCFKIDADRSKVFRNIDNMANSYPTMASCRSDD